MSEVQFSKQELERYSRHLIIPEFNIAGQRKLKAAKVLVVGTGGLGAPLLQYLTAAGVGTIGIVDFDVVDESNLQRQVLFTVDDVGKPKVEVAKQRLEKLNPHITFKAYNVALTSENALDIIREYDVVADGTDNFPTRYLVNDACVLLGKTNVYASIFRFEGQASVFNYAYPDGTRGPNYRDLFPSPPPPGLVPSCAEGGVLGVLPGILGSLQANEVIKVITGVGDPLAGRLFLFDAATFETRILKVAPDPANPISGDNPTLTELIDYEEFCGIPAQNGEQTSDIRAIDVHELKRRRDAADGSVLIDVREPYEYEIVNLQGRLIPQNSVEEHLDQIPSDVDVIVHCRSGKRSADVIKVLQSKYGYQNLYNLDGGILAWAREVDTSLPTY
ncbi:MAG: molybdopterin-synthase adenylyltransferase MoeB [Saprospiraceae bacterium]|nr:molybdopterin-synthase adenylyltransferase MoeB [Saprospiraceae bacterium]